MLQPGEDIGEAVQNSYLSDLEKQARLDQFQVDKEGKISFRQGVSPEEEETTEINFAETMEMGEFMELPNKNFSVKDL